MTEAAVPVEEPWQSEQYMVCTPALHSPLMGVTNAISSVIVVGAILAAGTAEGTAAKIFGFIGVTLAAVNIFGGFMVTRRMLAMFKKKGS